MDWIPAISSSAVVAILAAAVSVPYRRAIEAAISGRFDRQLEEVKSEFRREEERLKAELRERGAELEALRSGALANLASRHAELAKRRVQAVERVWAQVIEMGNLKLLSKFAETLRMEEMLTRMEAGGPEARKLSEFADTLLKSANADQVKPPEHPAAKERPFLPEITYALYSAYVQLLTGPLMHLQAIKASVPPKVLAGPEKMAEVLKQALPHQTPFIDEHGASGFPFLVDELEAALLRSLREALDQRDADEAAVAQAARLMAAVRSAAAPQAPEPPR